MQKLTLKKPLVVSTLNASKKELLKQRTVMIEDVATERKPKQNEDDSEM
jgi:hypothetical protein